MATQSRPTNPFETSYASPKHSRTDDWEDWDTDSGDSTSASHADGILIDLSGNNLEERTRRSSHKPAGSRLTQHRPVQLPRVKSRARQKTQNAKAGIKVVTDMSLFHKAGPAADTKGRNKFADIAALQALEGNATSPSIGSFAWLKRRPGNARSKKSMMLTAEDYSADLSPDSRPIVIGISVPSDDVGSHQVSPQTAVIETPMEIRAFSRKSGGKAPTPQQLRSVWSPDTEVTDSPYSARRPVSSVYSQYNPFDGSRIASDAPPVPQLPVTVKVEQASRLRDQDDDDDSSPCTPFEEDDFPIAKRKSQKLKPVVASPESASSRAYGWWDHVTTPFTQQSNNPFKVQQPQAGSSSTSTPQEWWSGRDEKKSLSSKAPHLTITTPAYGREREANTLDAITPAPMQQPREQGHSEKAHILLEESQSNEAPPPYEYSKTIPDTKIILTQPYVSSQPIPSPGPITPGFSGTMSSQGGINLADVPLTPSGVRPVPSAVLPDRVAGSYRTGDHFHEARGKANKSERQRRRHEKEDVMARKLGGFWRGRGCIPEQGCYGRSGREGRKRRRICLGVLGGVIAAIILIVVLVVVLTKQAMSVTEKPSESESQAVPNHWLNLTDFPPMPTGIVTVAGPNNSVAVSGCFSDNKTASTAWSCALPKEEHDSVSPYNPTQPEFIFQIQFDNQSQALWKLADRAAKPGQDRKTFITDPGFDPQPEPPSLEEMRFLGNTTDNIRSDRKEGEPTPFFISLLKSIDKVVGPDMLTRRQGNAISGSTGNGTMGFNFSDMLPEPELNPDGTGAPARLFPLPQQQPLRLFDRDLPTEHFGFYTYFDKKIYMVDHKKRVPADANGGVPIQEAKSLVTFAQTRFLVQIWTRMGNATHLLGAHDPSVNLTARPSVQPGSMPYPVTIIEDMHGGNQAKKIDFVYGVRDTGEIDRSNATGVTADLKFQGTLVNGRIDRADISLGGVDGGTGGCRCEWVNFEKS